LSEVGRGAILLKREGPISRTHQSMLGGRTRKGAKGKRPFGKKEIYTGKNRGISRGKKLSEDVEGGEKLSMLSKERIRKGKERGPKGGRKRKKHRWRETSVRGSHRKHTD